MKQGILHRSWVVALWLVPSVAIAQDADQAEPSASSPEASSTTGSAATSAPAGATSARAGTQSKEPQRGFDGRILTASELEPRLFRLRAGVTQLIGQGTFNSGFGRNTSVVSAFNVQPQLDFGSWTLFASASATLEYSEPDNRDGRRFTMFDPAIGGRVPVSLPSINSMVFLSGGYRVPASPLSRGQGSIGGLFVSGLGSWQTPLKGLSVRMGLGVQANATLKSLRSVDEPLEELEENPGQDSQEPEDQNSLAVRTCPVRSGESTADACSVAPGVVNLSGRIGVGYGVGNFSFDVDLAVLSFISGYRGPDDEFTSDNARSGTNATTFTNSSIAASYVPTQWLTLSAGISSLQPIQQADGSGMRFPFWNFSGAANNFSSVFVSTSFRY